MYPTQVFYSGQRRPYCALCISSHISIIDVAVMETVLSLSVKNVSMLLCDINCSELLRLHVTGHGTVVLYSLYRDAILSSIFSSLRRDAASGTPPSPLLGMPDDLCNYNMMIQTTRPIGLRPSASLREQGPQPMAAGYFPPCPCKVSVTSFGLHISDTEQKEVLCVPYSAIMAVTLDGGTCKVCISSAFKEQGCTIILYGLSPFLTEFVYIFLRAHSHLVIHADAGIGIDEAGLLNEEECIAERAALCTSTCNPEDATGVLFDPSIYTRSSQLVTGEEAQERSLSSQPRTPDHASVVQRSQTTAPQLIPRVESNQGMSSIAKGKVRSSAYFYEHLSRLYIPAVVSSSHLPTSTLSVSISTSEVAYTIVVDRAFQGFDSASRFVRSCSNQSLHRALEILDAARADYLRNQSAYASLEPIVLLSETHTLGIIPLLLGLKEAQSICLRSSMRLFTASISSRRM